MMMEKVIPKIALVFPGVGSQHPQMVKTFYEQSKVAQDTFDEACDILKIDFKEICFSKEMVSTLNEIDISQLALLTASIAVYRVFEQEIGIIPDYCLGHSLGEYSALCASGVMSFADALNIVKYRGQLIKEIASSGTGTMMWVINLDTTIVEEICRTSSQMDHNVFVSAYDTPNQSSISGHTAAIHEIAKELEKRGAIVYPLKMAGPFHSPLMKRASDEMKSYLTRYSFHLPKNEVIANHNGLPYESAQVVVDNLAKQLISPIRWRESIAYLERSNVKIAFEIGPKDVLQFLIRKNSSTIEPFSFNNYGLIETIKERFIINQDESLSIIEKCLKIAVSTKNYNNEIDGYHSKVVIPYKEIELIYEELAEKRIPPDRVQIDQAVKMVIDVLEAKKVPLDLMQKKLGYLLDGKVLKI